ncbi:hypothetical protein SOVF_028910 [Spinacia oleracea]|uniref:Uncharacterized protein n=1 Tax=Spinacia oleracea TaxID=3562 RepID=A0A9R0HR61_SPIOL|nr:uncharacterized protein LOC110774861 [Spinacia oleracea]KNA22983.1 hypothetical protein SOVF_028910 [Spinacia oleracea]
MAASALPITGCIIPSTPRQSFFTQRPASILQWNLMGKQHPRQNAHKRGAFQMLATPNASSGKGSFRKEVLMVDPLEAKKIADKQMVVIKTEERYERRRQIEAINGAWAMIGLTIGLVIEGHTGKSFLGQLDGYRHAVLSFFVWW